MRKKETFDLTMNFDFFWPNIFRVLHGQARIYH